MDAEFRFVYPDEKWRLVKGWPVGKRAGLVIGWNWRCFAVGAQWWPTGGCLHVGFLNIGFGVVEEAK